MESHSSKQDHRRSLLLTCPGGSVGHVARGHTGRSKQNAGIERGRTRDTLVFLGKWFEVPRLVNSNQKEQGLGSSRGLLI